MTIGAAEKIGIGILEGLDETLNAAAGPAPNIPAAGNPHYTLSQRWAYERAAGSKGACAICKILTALFKPFFPSDPNYDHCTDAIANFPTDLPSEG